MSERENIPDDNRQSVANRLINERFFKREGNKALNLLVNKYPISFEDAKDIVQASFEELFEIIKNGRREVIISTLSAYFMGICNNKAKDFLKNSRTIKLIYLNNTFAVTENDYSLRQSETINENKINALLSSHDAGITEEQKAIIHELVQHLPSPCEEIIWYYYRDNLRMDTIANILRYGNAETVRVMKSRCISKLRTEFKRIKEDYYDATREY